MKRTTTGFSLFLGMCVLCMCHQGCAQVAHTQKGYPLDVKKTWGGMLANTPPPAEKGWKRTGANWGKEKALPDSVNIKVTELQKAITELKKEIAELKKAK